MLDSAACSRVSELGVFGLHIQDGDVEVANITAGFLLRTKAAGVQDGGVAAGRAVLDSPYLCDTSNDNDNDDAGDAA